MHGHISQFETSRGVVIPLEIDLAMHPAEQTPGEQEIRRHALDQVLQPVRERNGDERRVAQKDDAQQHDQILQGLEGLCARYQHDE